MNLNMDYEQVRRRVEEEDRVLKRIVIKTGVGMLVSILAAIFLFR